MLDAVGQGRPLDQLQHQRTRAVPLFESVYRCDVGMVQAGEDFGLAFKPRKPIRIVRECLRQDFQGALSQGG